jgi:hypothetical protein
MTRASRTPPIPPLLVAALLLGGGAAAAQDPPRDPVDDATVRIGPVGLTPTFVIRDIGRDNNVFNEAENPKSDFTATFSPKLDLLVHPGRLLLGFTTSTDYVYFQKYTSERGTSYGSSVRADLEFGPVRPFVAAGWNNAKNRVNREIDVRARHQDDSYSAGVRVQIFEGLFATASVRQAHTVFDEDNPEFRGVELSTTLNDKTRSIEAGGGVAVTPLTTIQVTVARQEDRFDLSPDRDADTLRISPTVTFSPLAILSGTATLGYRQFKPKSPTIASFEGFVSGLSLSTTVLERNRFEVSFSRDLQYSAEETAPVYLETGVQGSWSWQVAAGLDVRVNGGRSRLNYRSPTLTAATDDDIAINYGASVGYHVREHLRVAVNADWSERTSERGADRTYQNRRIYASLTWGKQ